MYPTLLRIGSFELTSFGVLMATAALIGIRVFSHELKRSALPADVVNAAIGGVAGGLVGAKLIWSIEFAGTAPFSALLFSRGGFSWFGGLLGGVGTGLWILHRHHVGLLRGLAAAAPALALGHAIGRLGCFLVGDDYGRPSDLPWALAFPEGLPPTTARVHPTQIYELLGLLVLTFLLLRWRRAHASDPIIVARYLLLAGGLRFLIEFVRVNAPVLGFLTLAQLWSMAVMLAGAVIIATATRRSVAATHY